MKINTINTKAQQLKEGFFKTGSGEEVILIIGSCRSVPYAQYLHDWNEVNGNRFTIYFADPFNWHFDLQDNRTNFEEVINSLEKDERILSVLRSAKIVIHEWYKNYGLFNFDKLQPKNIYKFGLNPKMDICIPSWNDKFVLCGDIVSFDLDIRKKCISDYNVLGKLSDETKLRIYEKSKTEVLKFMDICLKSDLHEMSEFFHRRHLKERLWWTSNHISKNFTIPVFRMINHKFLHIDLSKGFDENHVDLFANNYTKLTDLDIELFGYDWNEEIVPLKDKLF